MSDTTNYCPTCADLAESLGRVERDLMDAHTAHASEVAALKAQLAGCARLNGAYIAENVRLLGVLEHIEGGDRPYRDESVLRQWAYEGRVLNRDASNLSSAGSES